MIDNWGREHGKDELTGASFTLKFSGGSRGCEGRAPTSGPNVFIFMQFSGKLVKQQVGTSKKLAYPLWEILDTPLKFMH